MHLDTTAGAVPPTRSKHAVSLNPETNHVYVLGGRNGNIPLKDFWIFSIGKCIRVKCCCQSRVSMLTVCANRFQNPDGGPVSQAVAGRRSTCRSTA